MAPGARLSPADNHGKAILNDSDHSYFGIWNDSTQTNRNYVWENFTNGSGVLFMDPYDVYWSGGNRNRCSSPVAGVCSGVDTRWDNLRDNLGFTLAYANRMNLAAMTPQGKRASTGFALANTSGTGSEYLVYTPKGGSFTVDLSNTSRSLNVEWLNPASGARTAAGTVTGGSTKQSFAPPFSGDAVLYLVDASAGAPPADSAPAPDVPAPAPPDMTPPAPPDAPPPDAPPMDAPPPDAPPDDGTAI